MFGSKSSPSVANFALHHRLNHHGASDIVRNFYADDFLFSVGSESEAISL